MAAARSGAAALKLARPIPWGGPFPFGSGKNVMEPGFPGSIPTPALATHERQAVLFVRQRVVASAPPCTRAAMSARGSLVTSVPVAPSALL